MNPRRTQKPETVFETSGVVVNHAVGAPCGPGCGPADYRARSQKIRCPKRPIPIPTKIRSTPRNSQAASLRPRELTPTCLRPSRNEFQNSFGTKLAAKTSSRRIATPTTMSTTPPTVTACESSAEPVAHSVNPQAMIPSDPKKIHRDSRTLRGTPRATASPIASVAC